MNGSGAHAYLTNKGKKRKSIMEHGDLEQNVLMLLGNNLGPRNKG